MSLSYAQKAALALMLIKARHLGPDCYDISDITVSRSLKAARGELQSSAMGAEYHVNCEGDFESYLISAAEKLTPFCNHPELGVVKEAMQLLRLQACGDNKGNGDGPVADMQGGSVSCKPGILGLVALIEGDVREKLEAVECLPTGSFLQINYVQALTEDKKVCDPFRINGEADIRGIPRTVTLVMDISTDPGIDSKDLVHFAYAIYHELVCHAFQGALSKNSLPNAHPNCDWTEGWMDTVSFDLMLDWIKGAPRDWLPLSGDDALGAVWGMHNYRYDNPPGLTEVDIQYRKKARSSYRELPKVLYEYKIVATLEESNRLAQSFSLAINTHSDVNCKRLKLIGRKLRIVLLSRARPDASIKAALACMEFISKRDLLIFEQRLENLFPS